MRGLSLHHPTAENARAHTTHHFPAQPQSVPPRAETVAGLEVKPTSGLKRTKSTNKQNENQV